MSYIVKVKNYYLSVNGFINARQNTAIRFARKSSAKKAIKYWELSNARVVKLTHNKQSLRHDVQQFHKMINQTNPSIPQVPNSDTIYLQATLMVEETFEVLYELFGVKMDAKQFMNIIVDSHYWKQRPINLANLAKELADVRYINEGMFQSFGMNSTPIIKAVHKSNMAKKGAGMDSSGKWKKPKDWTPPDLEAELNKQECQLH